MEKCERCGKEFSVIGNKAEKRLSDYQRITNEIACDTCQKKVKAQAQKEVMEQAIAEVMSERQENPDAVKDFLDMIINNEDILGKESDE